MRITQGHAGQVLRDLNAICNPAGLCKVSTTLEKEKLLIQLLHTEVRTSLVLAQFGARRRVRDYARAGGRPTQMFEDLV